MLKIQVFEILFEIVKLIDKKNNFNIIVST